MGLIRPHLTVVEPLLDSAVLVPGVVARQGLLGRRHRVLEDVVLAIQDGLGLNAGLVWVDVFVVVGADFLLILNVLMRGVHICMARR